MWLFRCPADYMKISELHQKVYKDLLAPLSNWATFLGRCEYGALKIEETGLFEKNDDIFTLGNCFIIYVLVCVLLHREKEETRDR